MIDEYWTFKFYGYHSDELKPQSHKPIIAKCDGCCQYRVLPMGSYGDLCLSCCKVGIPRTKETKHRISESKMGHVVTDETRAKLSKSNIGVPRSEEAKRNIIAALERRPKGKDHYNYGRIHSEEHKRKLSATLQGIPYEEWNGFIDNSRKYITSPNRCIEMNEYFKGSHAHHITPTIVAYIPSKLHKHISHNIRTGRNMGEMNVLAMQFINGELQITIQETEMIK